MRFGPCPLPPEMHSAGPSQGATAGPIESGLVRSQQRAAGQATSSVPHLENEGWRVHGGEHGPAQVGPPQQPGPNIAPTRKRALQDSLPEKDARTCIEPQEALETRGLRRAAGVDLLLSPQAPVDIAAGTSRAADPPPGQLSALNDLAGAEPPPAAALATSTGQNDRMKDIMAFLDAVEAQASCTASRKLACATQGLMLMGIVAACCICPAHA